MENTHRHIEQLEEAARQLERGTATGARLALVLLDNLAEVFMYRKVQEVFLRDRVPHWVAQFRYPTRKRREVLRSFPAKVDFLAAETELLGQDEAEVLRVCHRLRNEAYHEGVAREGVLMPIARVQCVTVCGLLPRLSLGYLYSPTRMEERIFVRRFCTPAWDIDEDITTGVRERLQADYPCAVSDMCHSLCADLLRRIDELAENLECAVYGPTVKDENEVLKLLQFEFDPEDDRELGEAEFREYVRAWQRAYARYVPPVTTRTLEDWRKAASRIRTRSAPGAVLRAYADIDEPLLSLEELAAGYAWQVDEQMELAIDALRGD